MAAWNVFTGFDCVFQKVWLCKSIWPQRESNTAKVEYWVKCVGFTQLINITTHREHLRFCSWVYICGRMLLSMCPYIWIGLYPNMYLPWNRSGYPPKAHILDPWGRAILHAPNTYNAHVWLCVHTPSSTLGSLGMGGGVGFTTLTISCLCSKERGHKTALRIYICCPLLGC